MLAMRTPAMSGATRRPELAADTPVTTCRKVGRYTVADASAADWRKPPDDVMRTTSLPNRRNGRIGSAQRASHHRKPAPSTRVSAPRPSDDGRVQPRSGPDHDV